MNVARTAVLTAAAALAVGAAVILGAQVDELAAAPSESTSDAPVSTPSNDPGAPVRVTIPAIGVDAKLVSVGLKADGAMQTPKFGLAAWYQQGPRPGEPGPAVLVAHVDSKADGPDVFYRLQELEPGDRITVHYRDSSKTFAVTGTEQAAKSALPTTRIWSSTSDPVLRLITCGGAFDRVARSYLDNVIVYADRLV
ncbi:class F sortase [Actinophytocola sp.]|uniref:class F sortase n=1 Tax=Actinophytocola sp. TaxID=1872138 RepID=UPI0025C4483A|nr:class F sortase [Actinophytocola sp.]